MSPLLPARSGMLADSNGEIRAQGPGQRARAGRSPSHHTEPTHDDTRPGEPGGRDRQRATPRTWTAKQNDRRPEVMAKALLGTHTTPRTVQLLDEIRALRHRVAELERALDRAQAARTDREAADAARSERLTAGTSA